MLVPVFLRGAAVHLWDPGKTARGARLLHGGQSTASTACLPCYRNVPYHCNQGSIVLLLAKAVAHYE